jgi:hypothetical protein
LPENSEVDVGEGNTIVLALITEKKHNSIFADYSYDWSGTEEEYHTEAIIEL